ncbi:DUF637 domain-containing protein [Candidatus Odyssella thessalonicensis]|uniref:DUF637 domain-containing protein n=1 Tax=Candidatus Odyssella thessalonicensis TaxID=84647 RepID=UPI001112246F|nr:DUF637 domain-containing protein [Candidatus Odyssella thessalonicensis]
MASVNSNVKLVNPTINGTKASVTAPQGIVRFNAGVNHTLLASSTTKKSPMWQSAKQHKEEHKTYAYPSLNCPVEVTSQETIAQVVNGKPALYLDQITLNGGKLTQEALQEIHEVHIKKVKGPGQALGALIALAMTILTYGAGAGFAAGGFAGSIGFAKGTALCAMVNAGAASLSTQLVNGMLSHSGNLGKAIQGVNTKALLISVASAGITHGLSTEFNIAKPDMLTIDSLSNSEIFMQHLQYNLMQSGVSATLSMVVNGEAPKDALVNGLKSVVANTVGGFMANQIGSLYNDGSLDYVTHKLMHSLVGGLMGAIICDKPERGALAGAIGAFAAEVVAEAVAGDTQSLTDRIARKARAEGRILSEEEFTKQFQAGLMESAQWGKLGAALATLIAHQDVNVGIQTGANAVENNFLIFAYYAAVTAGILYSGYKIAEVLDKEGPEAALKQLGIEIVTNVVGGAAFRVGAPVVFRFAGKVYTSVKEVVNAALSYTPGLKTALGSTLERLIVAAEKMISSYAEKYAASAVGKKVAEIESKLIQTEAKVVNEVREVGQKVNQKFVEVRKTYQLNRFLNQNWQKKFGIKDTWNKYAVLFQEQALHHISATLYIEIML